MNRGRAPIVLHGIHQFLSQSSVLVQRTVTCPTIPASQLLLTDTRQDTLGFPGAIDNFVPRLIAWYEPSSPKVAVVVCLISQLFRDPPRVVCIKPVLEDCVATSELICLSPGIS